MDTCTVAAIQMNSQPDLDHNLDQAGNLIREAAGEGARFVGLPENFAFLGNLGQRIEQSVEISTQAEKFLHAMASEYGIYLLGGSFPVLAASGKVLNRSLLLGPEGEELARYDKIHLFDVDLEGGESYRESDYVEAGDIEAVVYPCGEIGNVGLSICYDLRFPELYRELAGKGAEVLTVPSAFTRTTGKDHWVPLLRARAIENTSYVFAPAQTGVHGANRETYGHSLIVDPWGRVLADGGTEMGVCYAELDGGRLEEARASIPSLKHRRM